MELLARTNPLEDLGRLMVRPLAFSAHLASDESTVSDWALWKAFGFYLFAVTLVAISNLAPNATLTADLLDVISEMLRPVLERFGATSANVTAFETLTFFGVRFANEVIIFTTLVKAFCAQLLFAAILALIWPHWGFRRLLCWTSYSHWFVILGLLTGSQILTGILATLFLSRVTLEAEGRLGTWNLLNRWGLIGILAIFVTIAGLSLT